MDKLRYLIWLLPLAVVVLAAWLPGLLPEAVKAFIGHAVLSLTVIAALILWLVSGYAQAMRS